MAVIDDVIMELGKIGLWIQAVGLIVILLIIFQAITMYYNRKRRMLLRDINSRLERIEMKLDKFGKKRN